MTPYLTGKMVCKAAWIPARGTVLVGESNDPFNPTEGSLSFTTSSPSEQAEEGGKGVSPITATYAELIQQHSTPLESLLNIASLCNVAKVFKGDEGWAARGDPTECAIQVFAHRFDWGRESLTEGDSPKWSECFPLAVTRRTLVDLSFRPSALLKEFPFDSDLKRSMS